MEGRFFFLMLPKKNRAWWKTQDQKVELLNIGNISHRTSETDTRIQFPESWSSTMAAKLVLKPVFSHDDALSFSHGLTHTQTSPCLCKISPFSKNLLSYILFWLPRMACEILFPRPGIEPEPPAVEEWSLNHGTVREVLIYFIFKQPQTTFLWE